MPILQMRRRAQEGNSGTKPGFTPPASSDSPETDIQTLPLLYSCPGVFVNLVTLPLREETGSGEPGSGEPALCRHRGHSSGRETQFLPREAPCPSYLLTPCLPPSPCPLHPSPSSLPLPAAASTLASSLGPSSPPLRVSLGHKPAPPLLLTVHGCPVPSGQDPGPLLASCAPHHTLLTPNSIHPLGPRPNAPSSRKPSLMLQLDQMALSGHPLPQPCPLWVITVWGCVCAPHQTVSPQWAGAELSLSPLCPQLPGQAFGK